MNRVVTFSTFDVFHIGHLRILDRAQDLGDYFLASVCIN